MQLKRQLGSEGTFGAEGGLVLWQEAWWHAMMRWAFSWSQPCRTVTGDANNTAQQETTSHMDGVRCGLYVAYCNVRLGTRCQHELNNELRFQAVLFASLGVQPRCQRLQWLQMCRASRGEPVPGLAGENVRVSFSGSGGGDVQVDDVGALGAPSIPAQAAKPRGHRRQQQHGPRLLFSGPVGRTGGPGSSPTDWREAGSS